MTNKVSSAFGWKFFERFSVQMMNFVVTLILARILSPDDYGVVSLITIFTTLATTFVQTGFNTALIQKKQIEDNDYKSVLLFSFGIASVLYLILFVAAPFLGGFFEKSELSPLLRVMALILFPGAYNSVQIAYVTRDLRFKLLTKSSLISGGVAAVIGFVIAFCGGGAWALVAQQLANQVLNCVVLSLQTKWIPKGHFSSNSIKELIPFGSKIWASSFLVALFLDIRSVFIGKVYTTEMLAFFNRGKQFPQAIMDSVNGTIQTVLLPIYSEKQDSVKEVLAQVRLTIRMLTLVLFPLMVGLASVAKPMINLLLTEKWLECVPFLQIFAVGYLFQTVQLSVIQAFKALGDGGTPLRLEIIKKTIEMTLLVLLINQGVLVVAFSLLISSAVSQALNMLSAKKVLGYCVLDQFKDLLPATVFSLIMAASIYGVRCLIANDLLQLVVSVLVGVLVYFFLCVLTKNKEFKFMIRFLKDKNKLKRD